MADEGRRAGVMLCAAADRQEEIWCSSGAAGPLIHSQDELMPHMIDGISANKYLRKCKCLKKGTKSTEPREKPRSSFLFGFCLLYPQFLPLIVRVSSH